MLFRLTRLHTLTVALLLITAVPFPFPVFLNPRPAAAQTNPDRKAEAEQLNQQGMRQYRQAEYRKAQALRQAMLTIMKRPNAQPKDWAAFTLIGESQ